MIKQTKKLSLLSNLSQNYGRFLRLAVILFSFFVFAGPVQANGLPAPTLLAPEPTTRLGQDRVWVGGVAFNGTNITIWVDGAEFVKTKIRSHKSGVGSFGVELKNLALGSHKITSTGHDVRGRSSVVSNELLINIEPKTPAPALFRPVVNSDSGIERPFIVGNAKSGLDVRIVFDNRIVANISPKSSESGISSFAWQPDSALKLGQHKIEAFASDKGKLSNNSSPVYWQVGEVPAKSEDKDKTSQSATEPNISVIEPKRGEESLTVTDKTEKAEEKPIIPEAPVEEETPVAKVDEGRISTGEEMREEVASNDKGEQIKEISPGAVVKQINNEEEGGGFKLNNSLIVGIAILIFLLLSMAVWYVQDRKDKLGEKVISMFHEKDEMGFKTDQSPEDTLAKEDQNRQKTDLPPPPPPVF